MQINSVKFNELVNEAKAKAAGQPAWVRAIEKAAEGLQGGWIVTELADCLLITTESGETYRANSVCQCRAYRYGKPCRHRAAAQLWKRYQERLVAAPQADAFTERERAPMVKRDGNAVIVDGWAV